MKSRLLPMHAAGTCAALPNRTAATVLQASDAWELMSSMLKAAREAVRGDEELEEEEQEAAEEALELVSDAHGEQHGQTWIPSHLLPLLLRNAASGSTSLPQAMRSQRVCCRCGATSPPPACSPSMA